MGKVIFFLCLVGFVGYRFGVLGIDHGKSSEWAADNRLHARANELYESAEQKVRNTADFEQATRLHHENNVVLAHNNELVANFPKNCPEQKRRDNGSRFTMDLTGCKDGAHIPLHFGDVLRQTPWQAKLYLFGRGEPQTDLEKEVGKQLIEVPADADIEVLNTAHDDGSSIEPIGDHAFLWHGFVKFVYHGNADYLELIRK
jgi:hypothetical protein